VKAVQKLLLRNMVAMAQATFTCRCAPQWEWTQCERLLLDQMRLIGESYIS